VRPCLEKNFHKKELAEWLKVQALSSKPHYRKKKERETKFKDSLGYTSRPYLSLSFLSLFRSLSLSHTHFCVFLLYCLSGVVIKQGCEVESTRK
jgi:hypothetical protein